MYATKLIKDIIIQMKIETWTMSVKDKIYSYLNKPLVNHKSDAKLELICKGGHITENILHDLGIVEKNNDSFIKQNLPTLTF